MFSLNATPDRDRIGWCAMALLLASFGCSSEITGVEPEAGFSTEPASAFAPPPPVADVTVQVKSIERDESLAPLAMTMPDFVACGSLVAFEGELVCPLAPERNPRSPRRGTVHLRYYRNGEETPLGMERVQQSNEDCFYRLDWTVPETPGNYRVEIGFTTPPPGVNPGDELSPEDMAPYLNSLTSPQHVFAQGVIEAR